MFGHRKNQIEDNPVSGRLYTLLEIPQSRNFRIVEISGGPGLHRRLLALGFHRGDLISLDGEALLGGPVLVRNLTSDTRIALGRGIARKILVEPVEGQ
ncbi:MAG: FeoA domain-containing protein [Candidatus Aminicenantes bacterium]|nr:FeoA domain-containing protein [Candidatus Aminicenantes bacterium]